MWAIWSPGTSRSGGVAGGRQHDEVAQPLQQVLHEPAGLVTGGDHALDDPERAGAVAGGDGLDQVVEQGGVRVPEQRDGVLVGQPAGAGPGDQLVEHGQRVADRAAAGADDQREHARPDGDALGGAELLEVAHQDVRRHEPERVVVRPGPDGADDLVGLGGREDELHVLRRLLDDLEQRVEALRGDHVGLVEDEDLVPVARGGEGRALAQVAGVVDAAVAGRVDLDDVEAAGAAARELHAGLAPPAGGVGRTLRAVEAAGEDARGGRLAAAARAGEQVGVVRLPGAQRLPERCGDVVLAHDLREGLGPVAAVQGCRHPQNSRGARRHRGTPRRGHAQDPESPRPTS
jgi:hypothetical protein